MVERETGGGDSEAGDCSGMGGSSKGLYDEPLGVVECLASDAVSALRIGDGLVGASEGVEGEVEDPRTVSTGIDGGRASASPLSHLLSSLSSLAIK